MIEMEEEENADGERERCVPNKTDIVMPTWPREKKLRRKSHEGSCAGKVENNLKKNFFCI